MSLICPHCGADLPESASFCLHCCKSLNSEVEAPQKKDKKKAVPFKLRLSHKSKKVITTAALSLLTLFICILIAGKVHIASPAAEPITQTQAVTGPDGGTMTDENGEIVYEVIEVTTEKNNLFLDKLLGKDKDKERPTEKDESTAATADSGTEPASDTSSTTTTTSSSIEPATSTTATPTTTTTTKPTETGSSDGIQWTEENGKIKITGYTGNASTVAVPAYIDGKRVAYLGEKAFANNSNITKIVFKGESSGEERLYFPYQLNVFYNLPNLSTVELPYETSAYFRKSNGDLIETKIGQESFFYLFNSCPKLSKIDISTRTNCSLSDNVLSSKDGVVFYYAPSNNPSYNYKSVNLVYYPPAKSNSAYTVPDDVHYILSHAFENNPYLMSITFGKNIKSLSNYGSVWNCQNLTEYKISPTCTSGVKAINGVLYIPEKVIYGSGSSTRYAAYYPSGKKDTSFEFESFERITINTSSFGGNKYIETLKFPSAVGFNNDSGLANLPSLKKIIAKQGSSIINCSLIEIEYI